MADSGLSKSEFSSILCTLGRKFEIIHTKWTEEKLFEVKFRTQISRENEDYNGMCDEWVDLFSSATSTVWVKKISNTGPKIKFRKQYQCWTHGGKVQKELLFDTRKCRGTIDIKVLTDNQQTRRKNKHIKLGLNVFVKINFIHLHKVETEEPFAYFVHNCLPLAEPPKPHIHSNENLPQIIANIVEKGKTASLRLASCNPNNHLQEQRQPDNSSVKTITHTININGTITENISDNDKLTCDDEILSNHLQVQNIEHLNMIQLNQLVPLQGIDGIKLQVQPQLTQLVVSGSQLDMSEPLLMCQPALMFDSTQIIPVSAHNLSHFVQVQTPNLHNNQQY